MFDEFEENPKRKTRKRKRSTARRKRNRGFAKVQILGPVKGSRIMARRKVKKHRRRFRRNPPMLRGMIGGASGFMKQSAVGALGIALNKVVANAVCKALKIDAKNTQLVQVGTAYLLKQFVKVKLVQDGMDVAGSVAVFEAGKKYLPATVTGYLADAWTDANPYPGVQPATAFAELPPAAVDRFLSDEGMFPVASV